MDSDSKTKLVILSKCIFFSGTAQDVSFLLTDVKALNAFLRVLNIEISLSIPTKQIF